MADTVKVHDPGELLINDTWITALAADLWIALIKADFTQSNGLAWADISANEANFQDYARVHPAFGASATVSNKAKATGVTDDFEKGAGGTSNAAIYGAALIHAPDMGTVTLLKTTKFEATKPMVNTGDVIHAQEVFTLNSET